MRRIGGFWLPVSAIVSENSIMVLCEDVRTLKIAKPLLRRLAFEISISGGGVAASGVSMRSLRPYLCGLSSGIGDGAGNVGDKADTRRCDGDSSSASAKSSIWVLSWRSVMVSLALVGRAALSSVKVAVGDSERIGMDGEGAEWRCACLVLLRSCSSSVISSLSSPIPSKFGAVAALGTSMTVPVNSGGNGDFASNRLKTFIELRLGKRAAFSRDCRWPL